METCRKNTRRLFFALWPDASVRTTLAAWQAPLQAQCGGRVMRAETLHCTLVFLGEVDEARLEALQLLAQEVDFQPFELALTAAHYWGHNHIVYGAPAQTPPPLAALVSGLEAGLRHHRFHFEPRPYKPHVTLLRNARWSDEPLAPMPGVRWQPADFVLVQSCSDSGGAHYEVLRRFGSGEIRMAETP